MTLEMNPKTCVVTVGDGDSQVRFGGGLPIALIAGPCAIEDTETPLRIAHRLKAISIAIGLPLIFKASYDKANRTSVDSFRGIGMEAGLDVLRRVKEETGLPVLSDVHETTQVAAAAAVLDCLQIPAFLCRQTDLILACAQTGLAVNVKKGQWQAPSDVENILEKVRSAGNANVAITDRGTSFGYQTLVNDFRGIPRMQAFGHPVVFDGTHSVQQPGRLGSLSGGERDMVPFLVRAATAAGADAIFMETHEDPEKALSDGPNMLYLDDVEPLMRQVQAIRAIISPSDRP
jgi:2-dehydro-3-deoxyphosphooctonate aldolase (KDO 8-P synthase)